MEHHRAPRSHLGKHLVERINKSEGGLSHEALLLPRIGEGPQRRAGCPEQGKEPRVVKSKELAPGRAGPVSLGDTAAEHRRRGRAGASLGPGRHGKATKAF